MRCSMLVIISLLTLSLRPGVTAQQADMPEATVIGMVSIDVAAIWDADLFKDARTLLQTKAVRFRDSVEKENGLTPDRVARMTFVQFKVGTGDEEYLQQAWVITSRDDIDPAKFAKAITAKRVIEKGKVEGLPDIAVYQPRYNTQSALNLYFVNLRQVIVLVQRPETYLNLLSDEAVEPAPKPATPPRVNTEMISKALKRDADRGAILAKEKLALSASFDVSETVRLMGAMADDGNLLVPPAMQSLMKARFLTAGLSMEKALSFKLELTFKNAETATASKANLELGVHQLSRIIEEAFLKPSADADLVKLALGMLDRGTVNASEKAVVFTTSTELNSALGTAVAKSVMAAEEAAARVSSQNNLKQLALAGHYHADASNGPQIQNICDAKGKPLLSWRVALLPYMDQEELYKQFKLDEPWDSEHNKPLLAKMPKLFAAPTVVTSPEGHTFYQTFVGKKGQAARPLLQDGDDKGLGINAITDGTSNTIMIAEAADAVAWTKPDDLAFDNDGKLPKLGGHFEGGFNVALCNGSARFVKTTTPEVMLKAMITANGGENVDFGDD